MSKLNRGDRPSPKESATLYPVGYQKMGQDGNMWEISSDSRGVHRWRRIKAFALGDMVGGEVVFEGLKSFITHTGHQIVFGRYGSHYGMASIAPDYKIAVVYESPDSEGLANRQFNKLFEMESATKKAKKPIMNFNRSNMMFSGDEVMVTNPESMASLGEVKQMKDMFIGKRVKMIFTMNDPQPIIENEEGIVTGVDDMGHIQVKWDNGRSLSLIPGEDEYLIYKNGGLMGKCACRPKYAVGGMTEHGLKVGDKIVRDYSDMGVSDILVEDKNKKKHIVDLDNGVRFNNYAKGGGVGHENKEMVRNQNKEIKHHTEELEHILKKDKAEVPAWVVSKVGRAATDLSDATHYLDGAIEKAADGMKVGTGRAGKSLMVMDNKIWDKLNIESGSQLYDDKELQKKYAEEVKKGMDKLGYDLLNEKAHDVLENWNYHALNSALTYMGYYGQERLNRALDFNKKMEEIGRNNYGLDIQIFLNKGNQYANGGGVGKEYKLRAEGLNDFMSFLNTCYFDIKSFTVEIPSYGMPDVVVTFSTYLSLKQIKENLQKVPDSHVMLETVKPANQYTGERYATGGGLGYFPGGGSVTDKMVVDYIIAMEQSGIMSPGSHKNQKLIDTIKSIVSMSKKGFNTYIKENPNQNVEMIYREFQDWKQTYANGGGVGRFDRHANMSGETRRKILEYTNYPIIYDDMDKYEKVKEALEKENFDQHSFSNYLYGLFDGYDYSDTDDFKQEMAKIKNADPEFHKKISSLYEEIKSYRGQYTKGGGVGNVKIEIKPQYYGEKDNRKKVALKYDVNYLITFDNNYFIELTGTLKPYHTGRDYDYEFEIDYFADQEEESYYQENSEKIEKEILDKFYSTNFAKGGGVGKDLSGNYFSTNDFVGRHKLELEAEKLFGKGWQAEDDVEQIQKIVDSLGGGYLVTIPEDRSAWNEMREKYDLANPTNDSNYDIFVIPVKKRKKKHADGGGVESPQDELHQLVADMDNDEYVAFCYEHDIELGDANQTASFISGANDYYANKIIKEIKSGYYS